jgi:hypothetical protein
MTDDDAVGEQQLNRGRLIPPVIQVVLSIVIVVPLVWSVWRFIEYARTHPSATPTDLRLPETVLMLIVALMIVLLPWHRLGLSVKKIGWLEFDQVVTVQKKESVDAVVALEDRVVALERILQSTAVRSSSQAQPSIQMGTANDELRELVLRFLRQYQRWFFNAPRIRLWGSQQEGFKKLADYPDVLIAQELGRLLAAGLVRHRISESGATLYKAV